MAILSSFPNGSFCKKLEILNNIRHVIKRQKRKKPGQFKMTVTRNGGGNRGMAEVHL